ncbi:MAG: IMP cyclohydrolase, partial [Nanoarchaeota archaeon]|nr:IMP cyclohydrolase [Nanoarchaeota archaeon]
MQPQGLEELTAMEYPGRGIIISRSFDNQWNQLTYFLTGRSPPSKARKLVQGKTTGTVSTQVTDEEQLKKGSRALLIYPAIMISETKKSIGIVASNGAQTTLLYNRLRQLHNQVSNPTYQEQELEETFLGNEETKLYLEEEPHYMYDEHSDTLIDLNSFEPDEPNWTPRINAMMQGNKSYMHIVKRNKRGRAEHRYFLFPESLEDIQGEGLLLTTYDGKNVNPLPSF